MTVPSSSLDRPLKNILVLGATGNIGLHVIRALATRPSKYNITAVTRDASKIAPGDLPGSVQVVCSDLSLASLRPIFNGQDTVISCLAPTLVSFQMDLIDLAIACNVARFIPSEFGKDTSHLLASSILPLIQAKIDVQSYLVAKAKAREIDYTAVYNGSFFDWFFRFPDAMGWDISNAKATIYNGGKVEYEVTTVKRISQAVTAALSDACREETKNARVFVNSFTITQNRLLEELERVMEKKFSVQHDKIEGLIARVEKSAMDDGGERVIAAHLLTACLGGQGGLNLYSRDARVGGLWNERLGLKEESLEEAVRDVIAAGPKEGMKAARRTKGYVSNNAMHDLLVFYFLLSRRR